MANKRKKKRKQKKQTGSPPLGRMDDAGMHMVAPQVALSGNELSEMTDEYQKEIRNSPIWDMMVKEFGEEKAQKMLKEFQVKLG